MLAKGELPALEHRETVRFQLGSDAECVAIERKQGFQVFRSDNDPLKSFEHDYLLS